MRRYDHNKLLRNEVNRYEALNKIGFGAIGIIFLIALFVLNPVRRLQVIVIFCERRKMLGLIIITTLVGITMWVGLDIMLGGKDE